MIKVFVHNFNDYCLTDRYGHFCCGFVLDSNENVVYEF